MPGLPNDFDLERFLASLQRWEPSLDAWVHLEPPVHLQPSAPLARAPLAGVPFGVKDVIDVQGQPTRFGSQAFNDTEPAKADASVVAALRAAGAIPVGKTRSTEFAFIDPTLTRNPYDPARSPGGSSSGSGAAVGAGVVPFALGTQTAGSLCRPATYCGVCSYKPGLGVLPQTGMAPLSHSFDAIGVIAASPLWLGKVFDVLAQHFGIPDAKTAAPAGALNIGLLLAPEQTPAPDMIRTMAEVAARLRDLGHTINDATSPAPFDEVIVQHRTVMLQEMAENLAGFVKGRETLLQPMFRRGMMDGAEIKRDARDAALHWIETTRTRFWSALSGFDLLLAYPVPDAAPVGLNTTGDQSYLTPWTAMGGPLVSLPSALNADGMPLGILLAAAPGRDAFLVDTACRIAAALPGITPPAPSPDTSA